MNTVKNFTTNHLWLNYIDLLEVVVLLMTVLFPNKTEDLNLSTLTGLQDQMNQKF